MAGDVDKERLKESLRNHIINTTPGLLLTLDIYARKLHGVGFVDLCVEDASKCYDVIQEACKDNIMAGIAFKVLIEKFLKRR